MAEIKIEKKKPIWPWILLIVILVIAAILFFMNRDDIQDDATDVDDMEEIDDIDDTDALDDTETSDAFVDTTSTYSRQEAERAMMDYRSSFTDSTKLGSDLTYTQNTMLQLVKAVEIKANQFNVDASQTINELKMNLDPTTTPANGTQQMSSDMMTTKAGKVVDVIEKVQQKQFPGLADDVTQLRMKVNEMTSNTNIDQQRSNLQAFFNDAADLLNNMNI